MGSSFSNLTEWGRTNGNGPGPGLGDIPGSCVSCVFMSLTPPEICNIARLNRPFREAASWDAVWDTKLPCNFMERSFCTSFAPRPVSFDDGNKEVWLDKVTGRVCLSISAKSMSITGIDDQRYWTWVQTEESRFNIMSYLQQMWWFEVAGSIKFPLPADI